MMLMCLMCEQENFNCSCVLGFAGRHCDIVLDFCNGSDCRHGATCVNLFDISSYMCHCTPGQSAAFGLL